MRAEMRIPETLPRSGLWLVCPVFRARTPLPGLVTVCNVPHVVKVAPSILAADFRWLQSEVERAEKGGADLLHLDVMDGRFVPNISFGPLIVRAVRRCTGLPLVVHLMVEDPRVIMMPAIDAGADTIIIHVEVPEDPVALLGDIRSAGVNVGAAINPGTSLDRILPLLPLVDAALVMSVAPGFGGQPYLLPSADRIASIKRERDKLGCRAQIAVDGGIDRYSAREAKAAGCDVLVAGSSVFDGGDIGRNIEVLRQA